MLVLSRKVGEQIRIGDNITVVVQRVAGGRVSLAIKAPNDVRILRSELNAFGNEVEEAEDRNNSDLPLPGVGNGATDRYVTGTAGDYMIA